MSAANSLVIASRCSVLSNGCRVASIEGCVTSSSQRKSRYPTSTPLRSHHVSASPASHQKSRNGILTAATGACVMCHSLRLTAACSASSGLNSTLHRHGNTPVKHFSTSAPQSSHRVTSLVSGGKYSQNHLLQSDHILPSLTTAATLSPSSNLSTNPSTLTKASIHTSSKLTDSSAFVSDALCGLTGQAMNSTVTFGDGISQSGWRMSEFIAALGLASTLTAGSLLLGPFDDIKGDDKGTKGGGNGGGNGRGGGGGGHKKKVSAGDENGSKYAEESNEPQVTVGLATVPPAYEVSVRALRGGRLSMEDEFIVVGGGRLSAVFDGHGGGGVSQYLRDHLHIVLSQQLEQQRNNMSRKFRGDLKSFMFGKKKSNDNEVKDESTEDEAKPKYDLSGMGELPVSAVANALKESFDQVDKEILSKDEYEYQGSTAVAVLMHEANDGTRTLLSANIGDSRAILARDGKAVDLTRDHKPNDDKEKARILAMGEKIEWDHYCKVHRVRNLSLSRAVGDRFAKPAVSGEVEIKRFPVRDDKDEFILLASDGLWDVMTSQDVVSYVHKRMTAPPKDGADVNSEEDLQRLKYVRRKNMSRFIANEALRRGSGDNISVVIVWLKQL